MWILPTRNRQAMCQTTLDAAERTGFLGHGIVSLDGCAYEGLRVPPGWSVKRWRDHVGLARQINWLLKVYPDERCYGRLDDDMVPVTEGWQQRLEEAAGDWNIAYTRDGFINGRKSKTGQPWMSGAMAIGGDLARAVGYLSIPGTWHHSMDRVYSLIGDRLGRLRYLDDVMVEHRHHRIRARERDETDLERQPQRDWSAITRWQRGELQEICGRIEQALKTAPCLG